MKRTTASLRGIHGAAKRALIPLCVYVGVLGGAFPAMAQLNEQCTVSVLNRTAQVKPDGSWVLPNVPANMGQVRARATCVENGITRSGQSVFFTIPVNGSVDVPEIPLGVVDPIPESLTISAPTTTLASRGATTQFSVTATFPDGGTADVTAGGTGTNYTASNPAVATVSPDGLVTAVSSGTVVVLAMNEGALGLIRIQVTLTGDSDGDGIPDDVEVANGLDPNNPVDALEDFDHDGLTNKQELIDIGTNFRVADTDGDGIPDGEEVVPGTDRFVTNPLLADTDGDGVRDLLEIQMGSDPTDPNSLNLAQALQSLEVRPSAFVLTVNTIVGEASRQLTIIGHLKDGTTIDLTSTARGTNYTSSDLTVCNFGAPDGRVFAGSDGTCTVTATNSSFSAQTFATVRTFAPTALSFVSIPGFANSVDVSGNFAYVAAGAAGLQVVDVSNPSAPRVVGARHTPGNANDVKVVGHTAYVADGPSGLQILDVTDPLNPVILGAVDTPGIAQDVAVNGNLALVAGGSTGLQVVDVSNPTAPRLLGSVDTPGDAKGVDVARDRPLAVVADGFSGIHVVDMTDPMHPTLIGSVSTGGDARDVVVSGTFAFVADFSRSFTAVDISNPTSPVVRASTPSSTGGLLTDVALAGRFAFGADVFFVNGVPIIDVSTPETPIPRAILDFRNFRDDDGTGIAVDGNYVYLTAGLGVAFTENGTVGDTRLYIGQYLAGEDTAGIAPTVRITSPAPGDAVIEGTTLPIIVEATDDIAVASVSFLVNGEIVFTDLAAPFEFNVTVPIGTRSLALGAQAMDFGSNVGVAQVVMVTVLADPPPTVAVTSPTEGTTVIEGEVITISADATDDGRVESVQFTVGGVSLPLDTTPPFSGSFRVPKGVAVLTIKATATDNVGKTATATRTVNVIPDPLTTVVGRIVDQDGHPIVGATVTCLEVSGVTGADGTFSIAGLPTIQGAIQCTVTFVTPDGKRLTGTVVGVSPVQGGGTIDLKTIVLKPLARSPFLYLGRKFPAGACPESVAVADLNRDGIPDLVTANACSDDVSILLGNRDGTFQDQRRFSIETFSFPVSVVVADLNRDGIPDLVTANESSEAVSVLLGNGDGTFQDQRRFSIGIFTGRFISPISVAVADLNGDGILDLVTANESSEAVSVLLGNGDGTFQTPQRFAANRRPEGVAIADINGDGALDIVTANEGADDVSILLHQ